MAAHAHSGLLRGERLLVRLRAAVGGIALDRQLADGASPSAGPALARRAEVLRGPRFGQTLAEGLERAVLEADGPRVKRAARVPVRRGEVRAARSELLRLASALRGAPPIDVRALAMASVLLTDGSSPLFVDHPPGTLRRAAFRAAYFAEAG